MVSDWLRPLPGIVEFKTKFPELDKTASGLLKTAASGGTVPRLSEYLLLWASRGAPPTDAEMQAAVAVLA
jgi:hypothetical protein